MSSREYMAAACAYRALEAPVTDGELHELVIRHELQLHRDDAAGQMALASTSLPPSFMDRRRRGVRQRVLELVAGGRGGAIRARHRPFTASPTTTSARATGTALDGTASTIGRTPAANATWLHFV